MLPCAPTSVSAQFLALTWPYSLRKNHALTREGGSRAALAQGQYYFEAVRADPQALADGRFEHVGPVGEAELLSYAAMDAYVNTTGRQTFTDYPFHPGLEAEAELAGQEWDEDDEGALRARYPLLSPLPV